MDRTNWYGGKIQQIARLEVAGDGSFRLALCRMESRKSHRFARFLGSRRMLQISIQRLLVNNRGDDLRAFFKQKFVLCGRIFVAFGAKDNKVFLMETPEDYERTMRVPGDESRISLNDFVAWHNPLELNSEQVRCLCRPNIHLANYHSPADLEMGHSFRPGVLYLCSRLGIFGRKDVQNGGLLYVHLRHSSYSTIDRSL